MLCVLCLLMFYVLGFGSLRFASSLLRGVWLVVFGVWVGFAWGLFCWWWLFGCRWRVAGFVLIDFIVWCLGCGLVVCVARCWVCFG